MPLSLSRLAASLGAVVLLAAVAGCASTTDPPVADSTPTYLPALASDAPTTTAAPAAQPPGGTSSPPAALTAPAASSPAAEEQADPVTPGPALMAQGTTGSAVRDLQARLKQIAWWSGEVTDTYGPATVTAVQRFQAKRGLPATGQVDQHTLDRLSAMTRKPTADELTNVKPATNAAATTLDARCLAGRVMCVSKRTNKLVWVVDGVPGPSVDVRFGSDELPTREGVFSVFAKSRDHVSTIYHTAMPYAMFFSGGQAVHYSPDFAARGYRGASHGCVNVRDRTTIAWLFDQVRVGDSVVVSG